MEEFLGSLTDGGDSYGASPMSPISYSLSLTLQESPRLYYLFPYHCSLTQREYPRVYPLSLKLLTPSPQSDILVHGLITLFFRAFL